MRTRESRPSLFVYFGQDQDELAYPAHRVVLETTSQNQGSELSNSTMIPPMTVVADLKRSEDSLSLKPGHEVGDCHARAGSRNHFTASMGLIAMRSTLNPMNPKRGPRAEGNYWARPN